MNFRLAELFNWVWLLEHVRETRHELLNEVVVLEIQSPKQLFSICLKA